MKEMKLRAKLDRDTDGFGYIDDPNQFRIWQI